MNIQIKQRIKKGVLEETIKELKSFKSNIDNVAKESVERVRSELVRSGKKFDKVAHKVIKRKNQHGVRINIITPTETAGAETLVKITDKDAPIPLGLLNEQMETEDEGSTFDVKNEKQMLERMVKRILNEVFYKYL